MPNQLEVFVVGSDGSLYRRRWLGAAWTAWEPKGGSWSTGPAAGSQRGPQTVDVFEAGLDHALKHAVID
jgi:hypothetical protein